MKIISLLITFLLVCSVAAATDYCDENKAVAIGATAGELVAKCGQPDWKQSYTEEVIEQVAKDKRQKIVVSVEEWAYNLGPNRFMRVFKLQNGTVVDIRLGDYGYIKDEQHYARCSEQSFSIGDAAVEVMAKCGEPLWKNTREEVIREQLDKDTVRVIHITIEDWTYNFGPNKLLRIITFRNGEVANIRTGGYGYEEKP